jgi:DNA-binding transcriptional regulator LsrR (DeoR family)
MQANQVKSPTKSQIVDCDAERISAIIARLDRAHPKVSECLHLHYRYGLTQLEVAEKLDLGRQKVRDLLIQADWYIQSELDRLS